MHVGLRACVGTHRSQGPHGVIREWEAVRDSIPVAPGHTRVSLCSQFCEILCVYAVCVGRSVSLQVGTTGSLVSEEGCAVCVCN